METFLDCYMVKTKEKENEKEFKQYISEKDLKSSQDKVSNMETIISHCDVCAKLMPDVNRMKVILDRIQYQNQKQY